jgi:transposase
MFLKPCHRRKNGKDHVYWELVESYRVRGGSRHRVVAYLGELSESEQRGWARLGAKLDGRAAERAQQLALFEPEADDGLEAVPDEVEVRLKGVRVAGSRDFGDVYLALTLWRTLGLDELFERELPGGREEVPWGTMACVIAIARLLEPSSELHIEDHWYGRTVLAEYLGVEADQVTDSRLYRTLDVVLPLKEKIERHLKERTGELFRPSRDILLYDVTSTYFEGEAKRNEQAQRGHSRDHRPDCKQVCIGLVATDGGHPVGHEVYPGNRNDVLTLEDIVKDMEEKHGVAGRVWVFDRGIVSEDNLEFLRKRGAQYLVGTPRPMLRRYERELTGKDWREVREGVKVKLCPSPDGKETFVLCRSEDRQAKESAMRGRFELRIEEELKKLANRLERACKKPSRSQVERQIGRLLGRNSRAAGLFEIEVSEVERNGKKGFLRVAWSKREAWRQWAKLSEGCYLLRTNMTGLGPEGLWKTYIQLTDVEEVFRTQKSELSIRPIWHQTEKRVQAHILFSFLAYAMWKTLQTWMERAGLGRGVRTVLEELARIKANEVRLPTTTGREVRLCCLTRPDGPQRALLDRLGLLLPERLGRPAWVADSEEALKRM